MCWRRGEARREGMRMSCTRSKRTGKPPLLRLPDTGFPCRSHMLYY